MGFKAAFIFIAPKVETKLHRNVVKTPVVELHTVGVATYAEAVREAKKLVKDGVTAIELCAGFGHEGTAKIAKAVGDKAVVGVVRFDLHPGFKHKSGDTLF